MLAVKHILPVVLLIAGTAAAQVDFATKDVIGNVVLYQDSEKKTLFYYAPYGLRLVKDNEGKPDFRFIQMRYTGTNLTDDQGAARFRSLLRFKVANHVPSKTTRDSIKKVIRRKGKTVSKLQPLPIHNLKATLIHTAETDTVPTAYDAGFFEGDETASASAYWTERDFTLRLNNDDAQMFWSTLQGDQPTLSVNYIFSVKGLNSAEAELVTSGTGEINETMEDRIKLENDSINRTISEKIIISGALSIDVDTGKWPDLLKQIDINERIPPEYAALDVYCYDFNNEIREELYAKRLEVKAEGVGNSEVSFKTTFRATEPDIYAKTIKFIYAVKLDKPYLYRITEIFKDGKADRSDWKEVENWHQILDITTKPENNDLD